MPAAAAYEEAEAYEPPSRAHPPARSSGPGPFLPLLLLSLAWVLWMAFQLVMALNLPVRLQLLIPAVENAISGSAYRPGDVFKFLVRYERPFWREQGMSGQVYGNGRPIDVTFESHTQFFNVDSEHRHAPPGNEFNVRQQRASALKRRPQEPQASHLQRRARAT